MKRMLKDCPVMGRLTRELFSEIRKHAANFSEANKEYEHREKYSMDAGYYLEKANTTAG